MLRNKRSSFAKLATALCGPLVFTTLIIGAGQASAQTSDVGPVSPLAQPLAISGKPAGQTPPQVMNGTATLVSHYDPARMLRLAIALTPPHPSEERQFLIDLQDKKSPNFHQFPSAEQWNARFGPAPEAEQAVVDWAQSKGLAVTHRYDHRLAVDVEAPAGVIERALGVTINTYEIPAAGGLEARTVYSNDRDPVFPSSLNGIVFAVLGLNSVEVARPHGGSGRLVPRPDYVPGPASQVLDSAQKDADIDAVRAQIEKRNQSVKVTPPKSGFYAPSDMFSSYAYNYGGLMNLGHCCNPLNNPTTHTPRESSIAIASFGDVSLTDVSNFQAAFPYLAYNIQKIGIDGGYTCSGTGDDNCGEVTMDTEWSMAMANSEGSAAATSEVYVYEGSNYTNSVIMDMYSQMLSDAHARVMTTSWGWGENTEFSSQMNTYNATMQSVDNVFSSMVGQGWTLIAASGDNGAVDECQDALRVDFPASDPNVMAAGGTEMSEGSPYEVAWTGGTGAGSCVSNHGGSTGGFSEYWGVPGYQSGMGFSSRAVPDLSLDSFYGHDVYLNGGWAYLAGTSVSAPMQAGFFAQENAYLLAIGNKCGSSGTSPCAPIGDPHGFIYSAGRYNDNAHNPFYDMVSGCNSNDITIEYNITPYCAKAGFDEVTGWGSANMMQLAWALNWQLIPANGVPNVSWTGPATNTWYNTNQTVSWKVNDYSGGSFPGTGIAGFTQGWDSISSDPTTEPHGGSGNSFYSGPQYPNAVNGCLAFEANGCSGGVSQGCHTAHVEGWNNQGQDTGNATYGPICYDTDSPTISVSNNPATPASGWYKGSVVVTLAANDPGGSNASGIAHTYYAIDSGTCYPGTLGTCSTYTGAFTVSAQGQHYIYYMTLDNAGNYSTEPYEWVSIDKTAPVTAAALSGTIFTGSTYNTAVSVTLNATDNLSGVASTQYQLDGGSAVSYSAPFNVTALGSHSVKYWSVDGAGNTETAKTVKFTIIATISATISSPAIGTKLSSTTETFTWTAGSGISKYYLYVGTTSGGDNIAAINAGTALSATVSGLPDNGGTFYVTLLSWDGTGWIRNFYTYIAAGTGTPAALTSPTPGTKLSSSTEKFTWNAGSGVSQYILYVGTKPGDDDITLVKAGSALSATVSVLPNNGGTFYVTLLSLNGSTWIRNNYTYIASGTGTAAAITSPAPSSTLSGSTATFTWNTGTGISQYLLYVGTTADSDNIALVKPGSKTSATVTVLPTNGSTVYITLLSLNGSTWLRNAYTYTASGTAAPVTSSELRSSNPETMEAPQ